MIGGEQKMHPVLLMKRADYLSNILLIDISVFKYFKCKTNESHSIF